MSENIPLEVELVSPQHWQKWLSPEQPNTLIHRPFGPSEFRFSASSRGGYLMSIFHDLILSSGYERLFFLTQNAPQYQGIFPFDIPESNESNLYEYHLVSDNFEILIHDIDGLLAWCRQNPTEAVGCLEADNEQELLKGLDKAIFTLKPDKVNGYLDGEYCNPLCVFSVLKTVREFLVQAQKQGYWLVCGYWIGISGY